MSTSRARPWCPASSMLTTIFRSRPCTRASPTRPRCGPSTTCTTCCGSTRPRTPSSTSCACTAGTRTVGASRSTATCSTRPSATGRWCWRTTRCISASRTRSRSTASASGPRRRIRRPVRSDAVPTGFRTACSSSARGARRTRGRSPRTPMPIVGRSTSRPGRGNCGATASPPCTTPRALPRPKACTRRWRPRERCRCRCSRCRTRRRCCATSPTAASTVRRRGRGASGSGSDR